MARCRMFVVFGDQCSLGKMSRHLSPSCGGCTGLSFISTCLKVIGDNTPRPVFYFSWNSLFSILFLIAPRKKTGHRGQSQISRVPKGRESGLEICISICGCLNCNQIENQSSKVMKVVLFQDTRTWCSESLSSVLVWQKLPLMGTFQFLLCTPRWKLPFVNCCYTWLEVGDVHR